MARAKKKIHYIYKTTCNVTNKYYIGMHSTNNIDDGYMGSGKRLRYSIRKHGKENHTKEIIEYCNTREKLAEREEVIVNSDLVNESNCMNLVIGGGGFMLDDYHYECSKNGNKKLNEKLINDPIFREDWLYKVKVGVQKAMDDGKMKTWKDNYDWTDKTHSKETKKKMSEDRKGINNQTGTCWVSNKCEKKKINVDDLEEFLNNGWVRGKLHNINEIIRYYNSIKSYRKTAKYFDIPVSTIRDNIKNHPRGPVVR